jgi:ABC-type sugar transport system substrate-binding protein
MKRLLLLFAVLALVAGTTFGQSAAAKKNLEDSLKVDVSVLKAADNQPLIVLSTEKKVIPARPANPEALPETDPLHWYDMEYAGWNTKKVNQPKSPGDGAIGKKIIFIVHGDHPWTTACILGAKKVADAYKIQFKALSPNWDLAVQNQMIDQAINERPDAILLIPLDAKTAPQQARKINEAGIPLFLFNTLPSAEAMNYCIAWTGPDDFGQQRKLARVWADEMKKRNADAKSIGVAYVQHAPGGSPYYARCWGPMSELSGYAPSVNTLIKDAPGFDADKASQVVGDWLTRFGPDLKGIFAADDSAQAIGIFEALKKAGRNDVVVVAAGNSRQGMDLVKQGKLFAITYQTAEGDGALAVKTASDWFNGKPVPPVSYIPQKIITKANVDQFYPAQW